MPGIFELGAVVSYEVAVESSIAGTANFTLGLVTSFPNTASIVANVVNVDASSATGFDGVTFDPIFEINSGSATLNIGAVSRPKLTFGVDVVGMLEPAPKLAVINSDHRCWQTRSRPKLQLTQSRHSLNRSIW